jgi:ligand-binding sensor domain-containing protein
MRILSFLILPQNRGRLAGTTQGLFWQPNESAPWAKLKGSIAKRTIYSLLADPQNPVVYAGTDQGIYRASLSTLDFRLPPGYRLSPQTWCITAPATGTGLLYAGSSLGLLRSWDRGTIWNAISSYGLPNRVPIESIAISPIEKDHLFAGTSVGLFESSNAGVHWTRAGNAQMVGNISSVVFLDNSGESILAADADSGGVFLSKDGGQNWDKLSMEFASPSTSIAIDPQQPSRVYIGTESDGVYRLDLP